MHDIAPELVRRTKTSMDIEDVAACFVEEELGRFDFVNNWNQAKSRGSIVDRIAQWLDRVRLNVDPNELIAALDRLAASRPGRWL